MDVLAASLEANRRLPISAFSVEMNDSAMALSSADPTLPIEGNMPASSSLWLKERAVYCDPRSEWWITPEGDPLLHRAISRALETSSALRWTAIDHPTTQRVQASRMKAR